MSRAMSGRVVRRLTAMGAGAALVAAGLSLGAVAPANAASVVTGGVTDGFGNPISGTVSYYRQQGDGTYGAPSGYIYVGNDGYIESTLSDGIYKFEFDTADDYNEFYQDKTDLATANAVEVAGGTPVALGSWTVDQPYVVGAVTNAAGKPLSASIEVFDAASGASVRNAGTDEQGTFKIATQSAPVKLSFSAEDHALEFYADAADLASAAPVTATPTGADLGKIVLASGGSVSGQVTSDAGVPLEYVYVSAGNRSDYTDKNGVYTIQNVRTGKQVVEFSDPIDEYASEYYNNAATEALATPVSVGVGQAVGGINAALTPRPVDTTRTTEITGMVKDNLGVPVVGAFVGAVTTPARSSDRRTVEFVYTNRQGIFSFTELEKVQGENQFKIAAEVHAQGDDNAFALFGSWYGGAQDYDRAPVVTVTPGTPVGAVDVVLERAGGIAGSVTGLPGVPLRPQVSLRGKDDGAYVNSFADFEADSTFETRSLRAGTYKVRFDDSSGFHAGEWWKDKAEVDDAVVITVKSGQLVTGLAAVLGNRLTAIERPSLSVDYPWVGRAITADPGVWNVQSLTDFDYEWLVGSVVVGTGETFTPNTAHIGDRLTLRVTAENRKLIGSATSVTSVKIGYKPKIKVKTSGGKAAIKIKANPVKAKKIKGKVVVKEIVKVKGNGTIKYKKIAKAKIKKGKGAVSLAKLKKGKHKLVFFFTGKGKVGSNDEKVKVKIKR